MGVMNDDINKTFEALKQKRDELKVKIGLGKLEAREQWEDLENDWAKLEAKMKRLRTAGEDSVDDVVADAQGLMKDLRDGFKSLRDRA